MWPHVAPCRVLGPQNLCLQSLQGFYWSGFASRWIFFYFFFMVLKEVSHVCLSTALGALFL